MNAPPHATGQLRAMRGVLYAMVALSAVYAIAVGNWRVAVVCAALYAVVDRMLWASQRVKRPVHVSPLHEEAVADPDDDDNNGRHQWRQI